MSMSFHTIENISPVCLRVSPSFHAMLRLNTYTRTNDEKGKNRHTSKFVMCVCEKEGGGKTRRRVEHRYMFSLQHIITDV